MAKQKGKVKEAFLNSRFHPKTFSSQASEFGKISEEMAKGEYFLSLEALLLSFSPFFIKHLYFLQTDKSIH